MVVVVVLVVLGNFGEVWRSLGKLGEVGGSLGGLWGFYSDLIRVGTFPPVQDMFCGLVRGFFRGIQGRREKKAEGRKEGVPEWEGGSERDGSASIFTARPSCSSRGAAAGDCATPPEVCVIAAHFDELNRLFTHPPHVSSFPLLVPDLFNLGDVVSL